MRQSLRTGLSFGLTSGVITTLGLMVGLHAGTHSRLVVVGGVITIAIADALSDALGIHIAEESRGSRSTTQIWESTLATLVAKAVCSLSFLVPVLLLELRTALWVSIAWGLCLVSLLSYGLARSQGERPAKVVTEHLFIAVVVVALTHVVGDAVANYLG